MTKVHAPARSDIPQWSAVTKNSIPNRPNTITELCKLGQVTRAAYYKWLNREIPVDELENQRIAEKIEEIHKESPDKGYRRIRDVLEQPLRADT